jgi:hypothetical protein
MAVDGTYKIEIDTPMGKQEFNLTLKTDGAKLSGSMNMDSPTGAMEFSGGKVNGDEVSWEIQISSPTGDIKLEYNCTVKGDDISGEVKAGDFGSSPVKGKRV